MKVLDLFSGIGGFSLGLERAGMETVAFCEIDEYAQEVLIKHWPDVPVFADVKDLSARFIQKELNLNIDVICGGFPCQDISTAGKQKGIKGERSGLWTEYKRLIKEIKPRYAIIENVANLRSKGLATVIKDLWEIGYVGEWHIISARAFGAPHVRERVWIIAYPSSERLPGQRKHSLPPGDQEATGDRKATNALDDSGSDNETTDPVREGLPGPGIPSGVYPENSGGQGSGGNSNHRNHFRLWRPFRTNYESETWWIEQTAASSNGWTETRALVCGVDDGLSRRLHTPESERQQRLKQLGNSVIPQIPEMIGRAIMQYEGLL